MEERVTGLGEAHPRRSSRGWNPGFLTGVRKRQRMGAQSYRALVVPVSHAEQGSRPGGPPALSWGTLIMKADF